MADQSQTIGIRNRSALRRAGQRARPVRFDHDCYRVDDRLGHFHRFIRHCPPSTESGAAARRVDYCGAHDPDRRLELRRTRCGNAARRRTICVSARGLRAARRISVRMDDAAGDSDGDHRRRGHRLLEIHRRTRALVFGFRLDMEDWDVRSLESLVWLARPVQCWIEPPESSRDPLNCAPHMDQYARAALGQDRPKHFHGDQNRVTGAAGFAGASGSALRSPGPQTLPISGATPACRCIILILPTRRRG